MSEKKQNVDIIKNTENQQRSHKISIILVVEDFFPELKKEEHNQEKTKILKLLKESKLKLSRRQLEEILKNVKLGAKIEKKSYTEVLKKLLTNIREEKDIMNNKTLQAIKEKNVDKKKDIEEKKRDREKLYREELKMKERIKAAKESYQKLSPDLKQHSPEEINTKINALSPNTKARLKKSGLSLSDYAQFSLAREKIASLDTKTPEGETFLTTLKKMEKSLGIVEKTDGGYPLSNEPRKETFEQNPQLMEFAKNDESLKGLEKVNVLDDKLNIKQQQKIFQLF